MSKRKDYLSWDEYFMGVAKLSSMRSKDPNTQVGACIVSKDKRIVALGYNGMPSGCNDDEMPWDNEGEALNSKYTFVCHAELNAILNSGGHRLNGTIIYTTLFPCNECAKAIIQAGIKKIVYGSDKYSDSQSVKASKRMFDLAGVGYREYISKEREIIVKI